MGDYDPGNVVPRAALEAEQENARQGWRIAQEVGDERDRLRAVVDAARTYMESIDSTDPTVTRRYRQESMVALRRALRALDESPNMGENSSPTSPEDGPTREDGRTGGSTEPAAVITSPGDADVTDQLRQLVHDLWAAWNDNTIELHALLVDHMAAPGLPALELSPKQQTLLDETIRWVHNWTAEQLGDG